MKSENKEKNKLIKLKQAAEREIELLNSKASEVDTKMISNFN